MLCPSQLHLDTSDDTRVTKQNGNPFNCNILLGNRHRALREISLQNAQIPIGFYNIRAPYNTFTYNSVNYTITPGNYKTISDINSATVNQTTPLSTLGQFSNTSPTVFTPALGDPNGTIMIDNTNNTFTVVTQLWVNGNDETHNRPVTLTNGLYVITDIFNTYLFSYLDGYYNVSFSGGQYNWNVTSAQGITAIIDIQMPASMMTAIGMTVPFTNEGEFSPPDPSTTYGVAWSGVHLNISSNNIDHDPTWSFVTVAGGPVAGTFGPPTPNSFLAFMGYTPTQVLTGLTITATYNWLLNFDNYITIWIENLAQSSQETNQITFKIPMNNVSSNTIYWTEASQNRQKILVSDKGPRVDRLNVTVRDFLGYVLDNNGVDWAFSMDILSLN
jgi:hypothetical protein